MLLPRDQTILNAVTKKLNNITYDENDEENLHHDNDAKTIELLKLYHKLGDLMNTNPTDYETRNEYINAIMDFNCEDDANCKQYKNTLINKSTFVFRPTKETVTPQVYNARRMNFDAPNVSNMMIGLGGRKASKKSSRKTKSRKTKSRKYRKSRRH